MKKNLCFTFLFSTVFFAQTFTWARASDFKVISEIAYGTDKDQALDVYLPTKLAPATKLPVIVMVHGGGWSDGDKANKVVYENKVSHWIPKGFAFVSINYRLSSTPNPDFQQADVASAIDFIHKKSATYSLDKSRIILMGHSAGAHLSALYVANQSGAQSALEFKVRGVILIDSGAMDVVEVMSSQHPRLWDRAFGADPEFWKLTSPYHQLKSKTAPFLLVCGSGRGKVCSSKESFRQKLEGFGTEARLEKFPFSHREMNELLGKDPTYTKVVDDFISKAIP